MQRYGVWIRQNATGNSVGRVQSRDGDGYWVVHPSRPKFRQRIPGSDIGTGRGQLYRSYVPRARRR